MPQEFVRFNVNIVAKPRFSVMEGRDYIVLPVTIMVEGVHVGSNGPILYSLQDMEKFVPAWNHKPIVVYHPKHNGEFVSADNPAILSTSKVGILMANRIEGNKQHAEAWLEKSRLKEVDERILKSIEDGTAVEVSTGLFIDHEETEGTWNDEDYTGIARNYRPDHLALLPDLVGACSIKDGCGLFTNEAETEKALLEVLGLTINPVHTCTQDGKPGYQWGSQKCYTYQSGDEAGRKEAKRKAHLQGAAIEANALLEDLEHKYDPPESTHLPDSGKRVLANAFATCRKSNPEWDRERCSKVAWSEVKNAGFTKDSEGNWYKPDDGKPISNEMSHDELRYKLQELLHGDPTPSYYISDVFDDHFIYCGGDDHYKQKYKINDGEVEFVGDAQEVHRQVVYNVLGDIDMSKANCDCPKVKALVDGLISANKEWKEEDREWLQGQGEPILKRLATMQEAKPAAPPAKKDDEEEVVEETVVNTPAPKPRKKELTVEEYIKSAPKQMQEVLARGVQAHIAEKQRLIDVITGNETNEFTEDELKSYEVPMLQKLAALAIEKEDENKREPVDLFSFVGAAGATRQTTNASDEHLPLPTMNFKRDK